MVKYRVEKKTENGWERTSIPETTNKVHAYRLAIGYFGENWWAQFVGGKEVGRVTEVPSADP